MPVKEYKAEKMFYTMGEVTEMFDVKASLVRFWTERFDVLKPRKNKKGNRLFTPEDVKNLETIYHLVRERGMTLAGVDKYLKSNRPDAERDTELVRRLQTVRGLLVEIREELKEGDDDEPQTRIDTPDPDEFAEQVLPGEIEEDEVPEEIEDEATELTERIEEDEVPEMAGEAQYGEAEDNLFDAGLSEPFFGHGDPSEAAAEGPEPTENQPDTDLRSVDTQQSLF